MLARVFMCVLVPAKSFFFSFKTINILHLHLSNYFLHFFFYRNSILINVCRFQFILFIHFFSLCSHQFEERKLNGNKCTFWPGKENESVCAPEHRRRLRISLPTLLILAFSLLCVKDQSKLIIIDNTSSKNFEAYYIYYN